MSGQQDFLVFDGVILNGRQAMKDLARGGRYPILAANREVRGDSREILHPAQAGFRMTPC
jgi:hypothetical protein